MSEQVQTQEQVQEQVSKKSAKAAPKVAPKPEEGKGRIEVVEHPSGDFTIEHL